MTFLWVHSEIPQYYECTNFVEVWVVLMYSEYTCRCQLFQVSRGAKR